MMYKRPTIISNFNLHTNQSTEGETIETKIERIVNNNEPIKDGAPLIYIDRKEGVRPSTNIRTDRFEIAVEATDKIAKSYKARREEKAKIKPKDGEPEPKASKTETVTTSGTGLS